MINVITLYVVMLNVVMLCVVMLDGVGASLKLTRVEHLKATHSLARSLV
jgi:hypothetical protein